MRSFPMVVVASLALAFPAVANAQWYVGADAGASWMPDEKVDFKNNGNVKADYNIGSVLLGNVGYAFGAFKVEGELGWRYNGIDKVKNTGASSDNGKGSTDAYSVMANGIYDFNATGRWHPFVGLGIGTAYVDNHNVKDGDGDKIYSGSSWEFAYQGFAGVGYDLDDSWTLNGQYRYFATTDSSVKTPAGLKGDAEYDNHSVLVGLTYRFGAPKATPVVAAAPAPAPAPAPAKVVAPVAQNYLVFFDFNRSDLTPEAQALITKAATSVKSGGKTRIDLTGHADRSGSDAYNEKLSLRRAEAVKAALVRQGVPANQITVTAKGESAPLVNTADGVREPQNRRVEIVLP